MPGDLAGHKLTKCNVNYTKSPSPYTRWPCWLLVQLGIMWTMLTFAQSPSMKLGELAMSPGMYFRHFLSPLMPYVLWIDFYIAVGTKQKLTIQLKNLYSNIKSPWLQEMLNMPTETLKSGKTLPTLTLNHLMVRRQSWSFGKCGVLFHCNYSKVHSDLLGSHLWVK